MGFSRGDQETVISYQHDTGEWRFYTNVQKHMTKWGALIENATTFEENGRVISMEGRLPDIVVSMYKKREIDEKNPYGYGRKIKSE
ncbi:hypothetical protein [Listeria rocourtiae]|uniref:hypothetical protein n=1 Tax=Listeria rocourtiae TaxID=647910 RepID=UPI0003E882AF|nr:hypothetical protein [Listeria rocourtiae]EUJ44429.1 hypothetical protein PROCOU_14038 [Listeria rocourtiae FSL F6-920]